MSTYNEKLKSVLDGAAATLKKLDFEGVESQKDNEALFVGPHGALKVVYENDKLAAYTSDDAENPADASKKIMLSLLLPDADSKEVSYVSNEFSETLNDKFGEKSIKQTKYKPKTPQTVSKAAVKNGSFYDPSTLASKLCLVFPEIRDAYKLNVATYGDFLAEEFFEKYGTPKVIAAIKENKPATMKKLFQILNEIYEDGTNDTQSLIAVSILGQLGNDQVLLARCVDYMSQTMAPPVIEVNKFLATSAGKRAQAKLKNPPAYKPKKKKKSFMDKMMGAGAGLNNQ